MILPLDRPQSPSSALDHSFLLMTKRRITISPLFFTSLLSPICIHSIRMEPRNRLRDFKALLAKAGLPEICFHDLRHTAATPALKR